MTDRELIKELGGVTAVAKACGISQPGISYWLRKGIPELRRIQLKAVFPDKADLIDQAQAVQQKAGAINVQAVQPTTTITSD